MRRSLSSQVRIKPGSLGPQGQDLNGIAVAQEYGFPMKTMPMSRRMQTYLRIVYGSIKPGTKRRRPLNNPDKIVGTIKYSTPARPVWNPAFDFLEKRALIWFVQQFKKAIGEPMFPDVE
jgi:hypothetical protein